MKERMNFKPNENYMNWLVKKEKILMLIGGILIIGVFILLYITYIKFKITFGL